MNVTSTQVSTNDREQGHCVQVSISPQAFFLYFWEESNQIKKSGGYINNTNA